MKEITGCNALLTGASRGIGISIAKRLAEEGVNLALVARTVDALEQVRDEVAHMGVRALAVPTDLSHLESLEKLVQTAERDLGPIDILINNAAIENTAFYETVVLDKIEKVVVLNLIAPMILSRLVIPGMLARDRGFIVNISSLEGLLPLPFSEVYSATKHGLIGFTYSLNFSFQMRKSSLGASVICPGAVSGTGMYQRAVDSVNNSVQISDFFGTSSPQKVANAVILAIRKETAVTTVGRFILPLHIFLYTLPTLAKWVAQKSRWFEPLRYYVEASDYSHKSDSLNNQPGYHK